MGTDRWLLQSWHGVRSSLHSKCSVAVKARLTSAGLEGAHAEAVASAQCRPRDEALRRKRDPDRQQVWASGNRMTWPPEQLRTLRTLSAGDDDRGTDFQHLAELKEHLHSRRFLVEFEQADVVARNAGACRKFFLRHLRPEPLISEFITKHGTRLKLA